MYLILFDIDGTLVLTGRAGWRAMNRACADEVGHDNAMDGVEFAGRTDWSILGDVMRNHGKPMDRPLLDRLNRRYVAHLAEEIQLPGNGVKDVMPGIRPLLDALQQRDDVALGLLTGNFIDGARIKLEYFDLWKYFPCGAFGGDAADRNDLVPVADPPRARVRRRRRRALTRASSSATRRTTSSAPGSSARRPVAVATGSYSVEQLRATGADIVFKDLSDTEAFLELLR